MIGPSHAIRNAVRHAGRTAARLRRVILGSPNPSAARAIPLSTDFLGGMSLVAASGLEWDADTRTLTFIDHDPQLILTTPPGAWAGARLGQLTFTIAGLDRPLFMPRLYLGYDQEPFSEATSVPLAVSPDGRCEVLIADPQRLRRVRWDPSARKGRARLDGAAAGPCATTDLSAEALDLLATIGDPTVGQPTPKALAELSVALNALGPNAAVAVGYDYDRWVRRFDSPGPGEHAQMRAFLDQLPRKPFFSFIVPTFNTPPALLEACLQSLRDQIYDNFEICIADDQSSDPRVREVIERFAAETPIKVAFRQKRGHISEASNTALGLASGEYVVLVDHDDLVPAYCLLTVAAYLNKSPQARILYSDEDKLDTDGARIEPYFKSDFDEHLLFGQNMVSHLGVYERRLVEAVGGFRTGYEGSQDHDLVLRCAALCAPSEIVHIPHILYHWRMAPGSTARAAGEKSYARSAGTRAVDNALAARDLRWRTRPDGAIGLDLDRSTPHQRISIVILADNQAAVSVEALLKHNLGQIEIIVVGADSGDSVWAEMKSSDRVLFAAAAPGATGSAAWNAGVELASANIVCLLPNGVVSASPDWLDRASALLSRPEIGAVGGKILNSNDVVRGFGLFLGFGVEGVAGSPFQGLRRDESGPFHKALLVQEFSATSAQGLFLRRDAFQAIGGFDPGLGSDYRDVDLCLKLRARGLKVVCDPEIELLSYRAETPDPVEVAARAGDAEILKRRWDPWLANDPYYNPNLTLDRADFGFAAPRIQPPWLWDRSDRG